MQTLDAMASRTSVAVLEAPAPGPSIVETAIAAALRAPDHRMLRPWRFLVIQGEGLDALGEAFVRAARAGNPALGEAEENKLRQMPKRAPLIIVAVATFKSDAKVPEWEQVLSTGAAVQNLLLAFHDQGFGTMWRTGPMAESAAVKAELGLAGNDLIAGFVYVGTAASEKKIAGLAVSAFTKVWP